MATTIITSAMTDEQVNGGVEILLVQLKRNQRELSFEAQQFVFGHSDLESLWSELLNQSARAISNMLVCQVKADSTRSAQAALDATRRKQYTNKDIVASMPRSEFEKNTVFFFNIGRSIGDMELDHEFAVRNLIPADAFSLAAVNEADPTFADQYPNGTHWRDTSGNWCFARFNRWGIERDVDVFCNEDGWEDFWWFAGLRKQSSSLA
ncbi:MAG: hypothetical protein IPH75_14790 [bacterium]|nr:hypothetical protein [bacterium]